MKIKKEKKLATGRSKQHEDHKEEMLNLTAEMVQSQDMLDFHKHNTS